MTTKPARLSVCVMCGSTRVARKAVTVALRNGRSCTVEADVCPRCGEQYFDRAAMQELEAADPPRRARQRRRDTK